MIKPSNGRIVWFTPDCDFRGVQHDRKQPLTASICHVFSERFVNLLVIDSIGSQYAITSVILLQDDDERPKAGRYAEWMPYQKGQAAKAEMLEQKLDARDGGGPTLQPAG